MILAALASCTNEVGDAAGDGSASVESIVTDAPALTEKHESPSSSESDPPATDVPVTGAPTTSAPMTEPSVETEAPPEPMPDFVMDAGMNIKMVYSDEYSKLGSSNEYVRAINSFSVDVGKITSAKISRGTDYSKNGVYDSDSVEILVGNTKYPETAKGFEKLTYGNCMVTVVGNKLIVGGYSVDALKMAMANALKLMEDCSKDGKIVIPGDTCIIETVDEKMKELPIYTYGEFLASNITSGDGVMYVIENTEKSEYNEYLKKLEASGYTEYTTTEMASNSFATYTKDDSTVSASYREYDKSVRIIAENGAHPVGLESDNTYTEVTKPSITMLGCGYDTSGTGLCLIIRLSDGSFILVDGGHDRVSKVDMIIKALKELSKNYRKEGEKIRIAAWIVTHPHNDHYDVLVKHYRDFVNDCTVEKIMANVISDEEKSIAYAYDPSTDQSSSSSSRYWADLYDAAKAFGCHVQWVRTGQVFYEADLKMEVLYTIDSYLPRMCNAVNTTSLVIKMTFSDGTVFMMTGDATGNALEICADMYGDYLKSDVVQVSHHGYSTAKNDAGTVKGYSFMKPTVLLWPTTQSNYSSKVKLGYNGVLYTPAKNTYGTNENFRREYIAGAEYNAYTLQIPMGSGTARNWTVQ